MQPYISHNLSEGLCLLHVLQQVCNAGEGIQQLSSGQLCWRPLDFSSNTLPPGQPRQESTSCTSLRAASAGYCMDQHKWLSWKRLLALAPRQRYLGLGEGGGGAGETGVLWRGATRKCNYTGQSGEKGSRRGASGSWSCFLLVSEAAPTKFGVSGFGWLQFISKGEETRPTIAPFPAPHTHTLLALVLSEPGEGQLLRNKFEIRRQNGGRGLCETWQE